MKTLKENLIIALNKSGPDTPKIGAEVYDSNNEKWTVIDFCKIHEKAKLRKLMHEFDAGTFAEEYNDGMYGYDDFVVAAHLTDDERETALWIWAPSGLWIKKR